MSRDRIKHDVAWAAAVCVCDHLEGGLEYSEAVRVVYTTFSAAMEQYLTLAEREEARLGGRVAPPSDN